MQFQSLTLGKIQTGYKVFPVTPWNSRGTGPKWQPSRPLCVIRATSADSNAGTDVNADLGIVYVKTEGKKIDLGDLSLARPQKTFAFEESSFFSASTDDT